MTRSVRRTTVLGVWLTAVVLLVPPSAQAHDVPEEQVVRIDAQVAGPRLRLRLQVPLNAVTDAGLSRTEEGSLSPDVTAGLLAPVATQVIRNLDLRGERSLASDALTVNRSADGRGLAIEVTFPVRSLDGLSVTLNAFQSQPLLPVVTELHVVRPDGRAIDVRVTGAAMRVLLDPHCDDVLARFTALAAHATVRWGDHMLMLLCLLGVPLAVGVAIRRVGVLIAGQAVGAVAFGLSARSIDALAPFPAVIAASMVVIGALYMLFGSREAILRVLAAGVGVLQGTTLARTLVDDLPFAGVHPMVAMTAFLGFAALAEVWLAAIIFTCRQWLSRQRLYDRWIAYALAAFAAHTALHHMADAGSAAGGDSFAVTHATALVTAAWVLVVIVVSLATRSAPRAQTARGEARG